jgi:hypothetical protein
MGQKRRCKKVYARSALPPTPEIRGALRYEFTTEFGPARRRAPLLGAAGRNVLWLPTSEERGCGKRRGH